MVAEADVVFLGLKAYTLPEIAPRLGALLRPSAAVIAAQNGIPWWYFQSHGGPLDGLVLESVDPGGVIARVAPGLSAASAASSTARRRSSSPGVIRHIEGTRFSLGEPDRSGERALPADLRRRSGRRAQGAGRAAICGTRSG